MFKLQITYFPYKWAQDEAGTAAIKTVELDAVLGGRAVQHREPQGFESDKFLSYFKPCIIPLEGGFASGFKKPEEEKFETRLYTCRGKRVVRMNQVLYFFHELLRDFWCSNLHCMHVVIPGISFEGSICPVIIKSWWCVYLGYWKEDISVQWC